MKKIECIIRPFNLEKTQQALSKVGVRKMIVSEVRGLRRDLVPAELYPYDEYTEFSTKLKVEIVVAERSVDKVVRAVQQAAAANRIG